MDESRFQALYHSNLRILLLGKTREQMEKVLVGRLHPPEDIPKFLDRYEKGGKWIKDFGPLSAIEAIQALSVLTTNNELRRLRDRLSSTGELQRKLEIEHPKGKTQYLLKRCLYPRFLPTSSYDGEWMREIDLEKLEADRGLDPTRGDLLTGERCCLPRGTVVTLNTPSMKALCMPIGEIEHPNNIVPSFVLVAFLETHTFGILYNYQYVDLDEIPNAHLPENRCACFPGTDVQVSVGILEGLFTSEVAKLSGIQTNGYWITKPLRLGDAIEKDWGRL